MAATGCTKGRRFAAACGVLSRCVKAAESRPAALTVALPLMPGAEVSSVQDEHAPAAAAHAHMTIFYGGQVMVLEEVPADVASELLRVAAAAAGAAPRASGVAADRDLPMARKASLQRFMEKRKGRAAARGLPYSRPGPDGDALTLAL